MKETKNQKENSKYAMNRKSAEWHKLQVIVSYWVSIMNTAGMQFYQNNHGKLPKETNIQHANGYISWCHRVTRCHRLLTSIRITITQKLPEEYKKDRGILQMS